MGCTPYECVLCDFKSKSEKMWSRHLKSHHQCNMCGMKFHGTNSTRTYNRHLKSHDTPEKYDCPECEKDFPFRSYLTRHIEKSHSNKSKRRLDFELADVQIPQSGQNQSEGSHVS